MKGGKEKALRKAKRHWVWRVLTKGKRNEQSIERVIKFWFCCPNISGWRVNIDKGVRMGEQKREKGNIINSACTICFQTCKEKEDLGGIAQSWTGTNNLMQQERARVSDENRHSEVPFSSPPDKDCILMAVCDPGTIQFTSCPSLLQHSHHIDNYQLQKRTTISMVRVEELHKQRSAVRNGMVLCTFSVDDWWIRNHRRSNPRSHPHRLPRMVLHSYK